MSNIPQIPNGLKQVIHVTKLVVKGTWNTLHIWVFHSFLRRIVILPYRLRLQLSRTSYPKGCPFIIPHLFVLWILCKLNTPPKNSWAKIYVFVVVIVVQLPSCVWLLGSHGLLHTRPLCPSPSPEVCPNSCPLHWWCHANISSSDVPFICPQSFPALGTFPMSHPFASDDQKLELQLQHQSFQWIFRVSSSLSPYCAKMKMSESYFSFFTHNDRWSSKTSCWMKEGRLRRVILYHPIGVKFKTGRMNPWC